MSEKATNAVMISVIQNACHTPFIPRNLLSITAIGKISITYLIREIISDCIPCPNASRAPEDVTEIEEKIKPQLIIRSAVLPKKMVSS